MQTSNSAMRSLPRHLNLLAQAVYHWMRLHPEPETKKPDKQIDSKFAPKRGDTILVSRPCSKKVFTLYVRPLQSWGVTTTTPKANDNATDTSDHLDCFIMLDDSDVEPVEDQRPSREDRRAAIRSLPQLKKINVRANSFKEARAAVPASSLFSLVRYETGK